MDTFRKEYKPLTDEQKAKVEAVKTKADELMGLLEAATPLPGVNGAVGRCIATAKTNLEQAVMWAVKGLTA
jgi:hypothetical protein